ncbi:EpsG family protein [Anaerosalibacter bizertensis]|uniref:EpsG family protein n=1 Tax=Anaerosalibacter bizertensis TaxID=932217 RepID=UPI003513D39B
MAYIFMNLIILYFLGVNKIFNNKKVRKISIIILGMLLFLFAGFKYRLGYDWAWYEIFFKNVENIFEVIKGNNYFFKSSEYAIGYNLLNSIIKVFTSNPQYIFVISALIMVLLVFSRLESYSKSPLFSILLLFNILFVNVFMEGIRQGIAACLFFFSIKYIKTKEFNKYLFCILLATSFHSTAIILLPLYFLLDKKYSDKFIIVCAMIGILMILLDKSIGKYITELLAPRMSYIESKSVVYLDSERGGSKYGFSFGILKQFLFIIIMFFLRDVLKKGTCKDMYFDIFFNMYFIFFIIQALFNDFFILPNRLGLYFKFSYIICYPYLIFINEDIIWRIVVTFALIGYTFLNFYIFYVNFQGVWIPYSNYLFR